MRVTLEEFQREAEATFEPLELEVGDGKVVTLQSILLLPKAKRQEWKRRAIAARAAAEAAQADGGEAAEVDEEVEMLDLLALVADDPRTLRKHLSGQPVGVLQLIFQRYAEGTQAPEAPGSPSS